MINLMSGQEAGKAGVPGKREGFLWGVATSAFQLEGSPHADWTSWDRVLSEKPDLTEHYMRYREDLKLLKDLGVNAYRFSLEWSRAQPSEDRWDDGYLSHCQEVIDILLESGIKPMVTIHHFTHPRWFMERYPWHEEGSVERFLAYVEKVVLTLRGINYWITFNEPYLLVLGGYMEGVTPPGVKDPSLGIKALRNILHCHGLAYDLIHARNPGAMVSVAHNMAALSPWQRWNPLDRALARAARHFYNHSIIEAFRTGVLTVRFPFRKALAVPVAIKGKLDFFGVNYYTRMHLRFNPLKKMGIELRHRDLGGYGLTDLGWEIHPQGLEKVLKLASGLGVPLIITENGIATRSQQKKIGFIRRHVDIVEKCIAQGMDIRGYFYWSLIDNYEWLQGLDARFGLYRVDFETLERTPTNAAAYYSYLIKSRSSL